MPRPLIRSHAWWFAAPLLGLPLLLGCTPPAFILPAAEAQAGQGAASPVQTRILPIGREQVFPRVLGVLIDMGYQVRSADAGLGFVNIYRTWFDETLAARPECSLEATLLFEPAGPGSTRVRLLPTGQWRALSVGRDVSATVTMAQPEVDPKEGQRFLEQLAGRLCPPPMSGGN